MGDLAGLIERLEKLTGPDRDADYRIEKAVVRPDHFPDIKMWPPFMVGSTFDKSIPPYTASLDAAIALVEKCLPRCGYTTDHQPVYGKHHDASVFSEQVITIGNGRGPTAAIALLLALLRAMQKEER